MRQVGGCFSEKQSSAKSFFDVWHQLCVEYSEQYSEQYRAQFITQYSVQCSVQYSTSKWAV